MNDNKLVSVIIPSYKRCDTVTRAIESVLQQTYKNIEVCVVDDNISGDEYSAKLKSALTKYTDDNRVRYLKQERHINGAVARNFGVKNSKGQYVAFLDDDDEWLPQKIEAQMEAMEKEKTSGCSCLYYIYKEHKQTGKCEIYNSEDLLKKVLLREVAIYTSTFLCKKESFLAIGGFDENLQRHQDLQLFSDYLFKNKISVINDYLTIINADSNINRPNLKKFIDVKKDFFESINLVFSSFDKKSQKRIKNAHRFEIVVMAIKEKKIWIAIKYLFKIGPSISAYRDVIKRWKKRK